MEKTPFKDKLKIEIWFYAFDAIYSYMINYWISLTIYFLKINIVPIGGINLTKEGFSDLIYFQGGW